MEEKKCRNYAHGYYYAHIGHHANERYAHVFCEREMQENNPDDYCLNWERKEDYSPHPLERDQMTK